MNWLDLTSVRDEINRQCYDRGIGESPVVALLGGVGFVSILHLAQAASPVLLIQFVTGAVLLHVQGRGLRKFIPRPTQVLSEFREWGENLPEGGPELFTTHSHYQKVGPIWGLILGYFDLRASSRQELPIQQNALLALTLIAFQSGFFYDYASWKKGLFYGVMGGLYVVIRYWEEWQTQSKAWRLAKEAVLYSVAEKTKKMPGEKAV